MPRLWTRKRMVILIICFLLGLALLGWGLRLWLYKHPADYTEGQVFIGKSTSTGEHSDVNASGTLDIFFVDDESTLTVEGVTFEVDLADTIEKRSAGLSGREPLKEREGMLFIFPTAGNYSFWMKDMKFALDIIWISGTTVVGVTADVPPPALGESTLNLPSYSPPSAVDKVLEVKAGTAVKYGIGAGDEVQIKI